MNRRQMIVASAAALAATRARALQPMPTIIEYLGHACFVIASSAGKNVLIDPYGKMVSYSAAPVHADLVLISHEHGDHNNTGMATGSPPIVRGLEKGDWARVEMSLGDVSVRSVGVYHDKKEGKVRGKNSVMIIETNGIRIVHLGDLGHILDQDQVKAIGKVDVLMVPVGGKFTINAAEAHQVAGQLKPAIVIPMHFKTDKTPALPLARVGKFIKDQPDVTMEKLHMIDLAEPPPATDKPKIVVIPFRK